jgi:DNA-binding transcriptional MerR regulator
MLEPSNNAQLPEIPSKRYFTIGEVSELCDVKPHVLRYWEQEFPQLKPVKRRGNRRYYQRQDVMIIRTIRSLLYEQGYTIGGARLQLTDVRPADDVEPEEVEATSALLPTTGNGIFHVVVKDMIRELEQVASLLSR